MLSKAERRPARDDFPPRRMRATVPAHSKPECPVAFRLEFASLIERGSLSTGTTTPAAALVPHPPNPLRREEPRSRSAPLALMATVPEGPRWTPPRGKSTRYHGRTASHDPTRTRSAQTCLIWPVSPRALSFSIRMKDPSKFGGFPPSRDSRREERNAWRKASLDSRTTPAKNPNLNPKRIPAAVLRANRKTYDPAEFSKPPRSA